MNLETIQAKVRYLLGEITSTQYSDTNLNRAINNYYCKAIAIAMEKMGKWDVNGEISTTNLVASQQEYILPLDLLYLSRVEVDFADGTQTWENVHSIDERQYSPALSNNTTDGDSDWLRLYDNSIFLENPVETSVTNGLKIYYTTEPTALSSASDVISLPEHVSDFLVYGACLEYAVRIGDDEGYVKYNNFLNKESKNIEDYYSKRLPETRLRIGVRTEHYE